jgi:hypothetical protein
MASNKAEIAKEKAHIGKYADTLPADDVGFREMPPLKQEITRQQLATIHLPS